MPRRRQTNHGFNLATIVQIGLIPIATVLFYFVGNYFVTGNTLADHTRSILQIEQQRNKDQEEAKKARETTLKQFMDYQQKTTDLLAGMNTRLAVSETKMEVTNQTLSKIADEIVKLNSRNSKN